MTNIEDIKNHDEILIKPIRNGFVVNVEPSWSKTLEYFPTLEDVIEKIKGYYQTSHLRTDTFKKDV